MIEKLASTREWVDAGPGFEAKESEVRLVGWSRRRRVIVLRRRLKDAVGLGLSDDGGPPQLAFVEIGEAADVYEYSVLVTSLDEDVEAFGQLYRDRGDDAGGCADLRRQEGSQTDCLGLSQTAPGTGALDLRVVGEQGG